MYNCIFSYCFHCHCSSCCSCSPWDSWSSSCTPLPASYPALAFYHGLAQDLSPGCRTNNYFDKSFSRSRVSVPWGPYYTNYGRTYLAGLNHKAILLPNLIISIGNILLINTTAAVINQDNDSKKVCRETLGKNMLRKARILTNTNICCIELSAMLWLVQ